MSNRNGSILNVIRGGQTLAHFIGMAKQVLSNIAVFGGAGFVVTFLLILVMQGTKGQLIAWINYTPAFPSGIPRR